MRASTTVAEVPSFYEFVHFPSQLLWKLDVDVCYNHDSVILSGHRRWKAALSLGSNMFPCVVKEFENEKVAVVELNRQRIKTPRETYLEKHF